MTTTFRGDVPPAPMRTLAADTPSAAARTRATAAFALPRSAGSRTATFTASPSQPTTASRDAPGVTFTVSRTAPFVNHVEPSAAMDRRLPRSLA